MRIDENTNLYLYNIYEHGEFKHSCFKLGLKINDRSSAREVITQYINKNCKIEDNKHPLLSLNPMQARELSTLLDNNSKGIKTDLYSDGPSIF